MSSSSSPPPTHPISQFIVTTLCLSFFSGIIAMLGAWDSVNMFGYISVAIIMYGAALPGYVDGAIYWNYVSRHMGG